MKIKTSSLLLLGFAVVLAGCAAFVARGLLAPHAAERPAAAAQARATEAQVPPVWVAAAAKTGRARRISLGNGDQMGGDEG